MLEFLTQTTAVSNHTIIFLCTIVIIESIKNMIRLYDRIKNKKKCS